MDHSNPELAQQALLNARAALQKSDHLTARRWARKAASLCPDLEEPWLILAALSHPQASLVYLERALKINPNSERASQGIQWALDRLEAETRAAKNAAVSTVRVGSLASTPPIAQKRIPKSNERSVVYTPVPTMPAARQTSPVRRAVRFLAGKFLTIAATIFVGVFLTVMIASQPTRNGMGPVVSPFETSLERQIYLIVQYYAHNGDYVIQAYPDATDKKIEELLTEKFRTEAGLNLPYIPRHLLWTVKALTFDWGLLGTRQAGSFVSMNTARATARDIILQYLPNTLLLMGAAYLLVFLIGMPLSLYLARNYGKRADRFLTIFSPISSVPSWVIGILLLTVFAFQLHWAPFSGMYGNYKPDKPLELILTVGKHMILPVSAIVLSLLFQMVYAWRTFFMIYSEEDYVDLAKAKGLPSKTLDSKYILKPALPYIITSFITTLVGFWQLNMALESVFRWPGLGFLYVREALPNFWGESMEPGELIIAIGIVVIFAYLLGIVVFLLDFVYVIIDPRIRLLPENNELQAQVRGKTRAIKFLERFKHRQRDKDFEAAPKGFEPKEKEKFTWAQAAGNLKSSLQELGDKGRLFFTELRKYPSAIFGLAVILTLLLGSIYALIAMPYKQIGQDYEQKRLSGHNYIPKTALPAWVNLFTRSKRLSTLILDRNSQGVNEVSSTLDNGWIERTTTFTFDYPYRETPSDLYLYFDPVYDQKLPFITLEWKYPDGKTQELKRATVQPGTSYDFETGVPVAQLLNKNPAWRNWYSYNVQYTQPAYKLLFAQPGSDQLVPQHGTYQLKVTTLLFEPKSDLKMQFVMLGQVYGLVGTDYARRDLLVPLFWGMPFALFIGLVGTLLTTLVAMLLPAIGVWYGGWIDMLIQRVSEINMVLPGLAIAVLANVLFHFSMWIILGLVVVLNAFGSPLKIIRSALLQAKEAPYIEGARSYGASDFRIIWHYLMPRILPVLIPQLVMQVPSFIFWEATLGFFNIQSTYPTWGRIIYDGLAQGALYSSPFWVLEPIFLLLLTGLAFSMLGSALERILNPRMLDSIPARAES